MDSTSQLTQTYSKILVNVLIKKITTLFGQKPSSREQSAVV